MEWGITGVILLDPPHYTGDPDEEFQVWRGLCSLVPHRGPPSSSTIHLLLACGPLQLRETPSLSIRRLSPRYQEIPLPPPLRLPPGPSPAYTGRFTSLPLQPSSPHRTPIGSDEWEPPSLHPASRRYVTTDLDIPRRQIPSTHLAYCRTSAPLQSIASPRTVHHPLCSSPAALPSSEKTTISAATRIYNDGIGISGSIDIEDRLKTYLLLTSSEHFAARTCISHSTSQASRISTTNVGYFSRSISSRKAVQQNR
ncbi:hypothetical protein GE061_006147 [Apolygus lucorum]|uniref:Uncharacterized protein n=1 Tax=Apolygus lucorum TaxID=248454 RepID=A0A8S9WUG8_APOLU|nr:hypothetical protein GE061_006147 [Apolygus lucorum]